MLLWDVRRYLYPGRLGAGRVVVQFEFPMMPPRRRFYWVVDDGHEVDVCLADPGMGVDVEISADLRALTAVWMGDQPFEEAARQGLIEVSGPRRYSSEVPGWFGQHPVLSKVASKRSHPPGTGTARAPCHDRRIGGDRLDINVVWWHHLNNSCWLP